ncbi:MAG: tetratricopeptide repeat protein [Myxococcales bacterium]|nr:tetratricopeptide repeat protein [Myxococcales bacterium]
MTTATSKRLALFDDMIAKGSVDPFVHYARAMELRSLERRDEALEAFGEVAARFPTYVPTYLMAAQVCAELRRDEDALAWCDRGAEVAKAAGDAHALGELEAFRAELA